MFSVSRCAFRHFIFRFLPFMFVLVQQTWCMITMFITYVMYLSFCTFMSSPEPPVCVSGVGLFSMWFGSSVTMLIVS